MPPQVLERHSAARPTTQRPPRTPVSVLRHRKHHQPAQTKSNDRSASSKGDTSKGKTQVHGTAEYQNYSSIVPGHVLTTPSTTIDRANDRMRLRDAARLLREILSTKVHQSNHSHEQAENSHYQES